MHFAIFLRNLLKIFENSLASGPRTRYEAEFQKWSRCTEILAAPVMKILLTNLLFFSKLYIFSLENTIFSKFLCTLGAAAPATPLRTRPSSGTMGPNEINLLCTTPMFRVNPPKQKSCVTPCAPNRTPLTTQISFPLVFLNYKITKCQFTIIISSYSVNFFFISLKSVWRK